MFSLAEVWGWRPDGSNPCRHVKRYKEHKRERFLSPEETERLGQVLREAEEEMPLGSSRLPPASADGLPDVGDPGSPLGVR